MRDDLGDLDVGGVASGVVAVMVGVEDVSDRPGADPADEILDRVKVLRELVVNQDHALVGDTHADVPTRSEDYVESVLHHLDGEFVLCLHLSRPEAEHHPGDETSLQDHP